MWGDDHLCGSFSWFLSNLSLSASLWVGLGWSQVLHQIPVVWINLMDITASSTSEIIVPVRTGLDILSWHLIHQIHFDVL